MYDDLKTGDLATHAGGIAFHGGIKPNIEPNCNLL